VAIILQFQLLEKASIPNLIIKFLQINSSKNIDKYGTIIKKEY
jgi:hypothetical protein